MKLRTQQEKNILEKLDVSKISALYQFIIM